MSTDNTVLNAQSGTPGDTIRDLLDLSGIKWMACVATYATTVSANANVLQIVTPANPLPVAFPSGTIFSMAQSGTWATDLQDGAGNGLSSVHISSSYYLGVALVGTDGAQIGSGGSITVQPGNTANTTPWLANPHDGAATTGTISAQDAGVSGASGQGGQSLLSGTPTANSFVTIALTGQSIVSLQVTGSMSATLVIERSIDGGVAYVPVGMFLSGMGGVAVTSITSSCVLYGHVAGATHYRVRCTTYTSGTPAIVWKAGYGEGMVSAALLGSSNVIGQVGASDETSIIYNGAVALTPLYMPFTITNSSGSGATPVVPLTTGKKIRVLSYRISFNSTVNANWQSHVTTSTASGLTYGTQFKDSGRSYSKYGHFQTAVGEALDLNLSGNGTVSGELEYVLI